MATSSVPLGQSTLRVQSLSRQYQLDQLDRITVQSVLQCVDDKLIDCVFIAE